MVYSICSHRLGGGRSCPGGGEKADADSNIAGPGKFGMATQGLGVSISAPEVTCEGQAEPSDQDSANNPAVMNQHVLAEQVFPP